MALPFSRCMEEPGPKKKTTTRERLNPKRAPSSGTCEPTALRAKGEASGYPGRAPRGLLGGGIASRMRSCLCGGGVSLPNVFPRLRPGVKFAELVQLLFQRLLRVKITKNPAGRGKNRLPPNGFVGLSFRRAKGGRALVKTPPPPPFPPAHNGQVGADNGVWLSFAILTEGARSPPFYNICFLRGRQPPCESARLWVGFSFALTLGMSRLATSLSGALGQGLLFGPFETSAKVSAFPPL